MTKRWMRSPLFDLSLIIGPPFLSALAVATFPGLRMNETPVWGYFVFVLCIDVGHVYASLYRTYLDTKELARRPYLYFGVPLLSWAGGAILYTFGFLTFWRAMAYLAVFHFVRQQYGFMRIYQYLYDEHSRVDQWVDQCAIYATMMYPLIYWHADPSRKFFWFVSGDFMRISKIFSPMAGWVYGAALSAFIIRQIWVYATNRRANWGKIGIMVSTAAAWYIGIIHFNSDFAFLITNVVSHGVPYFALVWLYGWRKWQGRRSWLGWIHRPAFVPVIVFVCLLLALAYLEEGVWNILVLKQNLSVFGGLNVLWQPSSLTLIFLVPFLAIPQATHYVLDAWIWKFDDTNPGLRYYLFEKGPRPIVET